MRITAFVVLLATILSNVWRNPAWASAAAMLFYYAIPMREFYAPTLPYQAALWALAIALSARNREFQQEEGLEEIYERSLTAARAVVTQIREQLISTLNEGLQGGDPIEAVRRALSSASRVHARPLAAGQICEPLVPIVSDAVITAADKGITLLMAEVARVLESRRPETTAGMVVAALKAQALPVMDRAIEIGLPDILRERLNKAADLDRQSQARERPSDRGVLGVPLPRTALRAIVTNAGFWVHAAFTVAVYISATHARWDVAEGMEQFKRWVLLFLPLLGIICGIRNPKQLRLAAWAWILGAMMICYNGFGLWRMHGGRADDVGGQQGDANFLAMTAVSVAPVALSMFINEKRGIFRLGGLGAAGLSALGLLASGSRGGMIGAVGSIGVWLLLSKKKALAGALVAFATAAFLAVSPPEFWERMGTIVLTAENNPWIAKEHEESARSRKIFWALAWQVFKENPAIGIGPHNFPLENVNRAWYINSSTGNKYYMTHSTWFQLLAEFGVMSFIWIGGYLFALWSMARAAWMARQLRDDELYGPISAYCAGFFAAWIANSLTISFVTSHYLDYNNWILVFGPLALQISREMVERRRWFLPGEAVAEPKPNRRAAAAWSPLR